jgi:cell division protein ZapE
MTGLMLKKIVRKIKTSPSSELSSGLTGVLEQRYQDQVAQRHIQYDSAQIQAVRRLQALLDNLTANLSYQSKPATQKLLAKRPPECKSLYIYGDVGRGKSMLMDWFYEACPFNQKRRVHFNTFMLEVHAFIHECRQRNKTGAIEALAEHIRKSVRLLCFDEFHVTDIADAMILGRLFSQLFERGIVTVMTSNRPPSELYQGGLQREQFLFFINVLESRADIVELAAKKDFRLSHLRSLRKTYHFPLDRQAGPFIKTCFEELTHHSAMESRILPLLGRTVQLAAAHGDIALSSFEELCVQPLGAADYLLIAGEFSTLILSDIPKLTIADRNEAKRFVTLIDALYEHKVKLICTAEVDVPELYTEGDGAFEFRRTVSRLIEMQSDKYLRAEHISSLKK